MTIEQIIIKLVAAGYSVSCKQAGGWVDKTQLQYSATVAGDYPYYYANTLLEALEMLYKAIKMRSHQQADLLQ